MSIRICETTKTWKLKRLGQAAFASTPTPKWKGLKGMCAA